MSYEALQDESEFNAFIDIIRRNGANSYLEIGSKFGGSLWRMATSLPMGSLIVSVDMPVGDSDRQLSKCINELKSIGYDAHLILGSSMDEDVKELVKSFAPFDVCFIDANHTEPFVRHDWNFYGAMCDIVAFHDIGWKRATRVGRLPIEVKKVWDEIKLPFRYKEILSSPDQTDNGIGVLWRS